MEELLSYKSLFNDYGELRIQQNTQNVLRIISGKVVGNTTNITSGVSSRVNKKGYWGMASSPICNKDSIYGVIKNSRENANFLCSKFKEKSLKLPSNPTTAVHDYATKNPKLTPKERLDFIRTLDNYIAEKYKNLQNRTLNLVCFNQQKKLITQDGSKLSVFLPRTHIYIGMTIEKNGVPIDLTAPSIGGLGEFEDYFNNPSDIFNHIDTLYEQLNQKKEGVFATSGIKDCILAPDLTGILAHEAVGHTVEADIVSHGSVAANMLNKKVASHLINITDFANTAFDKTCPVPLYVDDEGVACEDAKIIEKGILRNYLVNKQYSCQYNTKPLGNARAFSFSDEPIVRMRNTCILPGTSRLEDMIASVDDGYYLCTPTNGQSDTTGEFMFGVSFGYEIKNGKLGKAILDTTVSGVAFEMLGSVTAVSNDLQWVSSGFCGKKQPASVGMGGPAIKCKITVGGQ